MVILVWTTFDAVPVKRGQPKAEHPKVSTTLRLDADVLDHFRHLGPGWQTRINATLRSAIRKRPGQAA